MRSFVPESLDERGAVLGQLGDAVGVRRVDRRSGIALVVGDGPNMVLAERSSSPIGRALLQASIAAPGNAELDEAVRVVHDRRLASARQRFDSAVEKGEIPPADTYFLTELLSGPVYLYLIRRRHPFTRAVAEKIVDVVLAGLDATAQ